LESLLHRGYRRWDAIGDGNVFDPEWQVPFIFNSHFEFFSVGGSVVVAEITLRIVFESIHIDDGKRGSEFDGLFADSCRAIICTTRFRRDKSIITWRKWFFVTRWIWRTGRNNYQRY